MQLRSRGQFRRDGLEPGAEVRVGLYVLYPQETKMKTAEQLFEDIIQAIGLPVWSAVVLRELMPAVSDEPNWVVAVGNLPDDAKERYENSVVDMRKWHPLIDWDHVKDRDGQWRIIRAIKRA